MRSGLLRRSVPAALVILALVGCGADDGAGEAADGAPGTAPSAAGEGGSEPTATDAVTIVDFGFDPADVTVPVGATVTWTNQDDATHSIEDRALGVESDDLGLGDTFELVYDEAGSYPYVCGIHNYMEGTVTVS